MMKLFSVTLAGAALAFALITAPAMAEEAVKAPPQHPMRACHEDVQKFCKDVKPGHGAIAECLKTHEAELSAPCKEEHEKMAAMGQKMKAEHKAMIEACKADEEKFCKDVKPGHGALGECMRTHEADLSAPCKEAREKMPHHGMMKDKGMMEKGMMKGKGMMDKGMQPSTEEPATPPADEPAKAE